MNPRFIKWAPGCAGLRVAVRDTVSGEITRFELAPNCKSAIYATPRGLEIKTGSPEISSALMSFITDAHNVVIWRDFTFEFWIENGGR